MCENNLFQSAAALECQHGVIITCHFLISWQTAKNLQTATSLCVLHTKSNLQFKIQYTIFLAVVLQWYTCAVNDEISIPVNLFVKVFTYKLA